MNWLTNQDRREGPMRLRQRLAVIGATVVALAGGLSVAAAWPPPDAGHGAHFRVAWLANDPANTYDNAILAGIRDVAARSHSTVDPFFAGFDPSVQLDQCGEALATGVYDALIVIADDPIGIGQCVGDAFAQGVPVAAVDLVMGEDQTTVQPQLPGEVAASFIPASRFGEGVAAIVPQVCAGLTPCNVYYVAGLASFPVDQYGLDAIAQAAAASPEVELIGQAEAFYDTATARQVVDQALTAHPEINVVIASGDQMALGAEQAGQGRGVALRIVGAGAGASALSAVRDGRWFATFNTLPRTEGAIAMKLLVNALRNRQADPVGIDPVASSGLPVWWTQATLAQHPDFVGEWPGP
jgi:ribose transport system substrate-binding protein